MTDPRITLRNRWLAGVLAFLIPGLGHWYQGRRFKGGIYTGCVVSIFFVGMFLGEWQPVYSQIATPRTGFVQLERGKPATSFSVGYAAQVMNGLVALPALLQAERFKDCPGVVTAIDSPLESKYTGLLWMSENGLNTTAAHVEGMLAVKPVPGTSGTKIHGTLQGTSAEGSEFNLSIDSRFTMGREIFGSPLRLFRCNVTDENGEAIGELDGFVDRPFLNWFQAPRDDVEMDRMHGKLNQRFDIALVFTWIAGLLNLLAVWDAVEGPAYGYGDEDPEKEKDDAEAPPAPSP